MFDYLSKNILETQSEHQSKGDKYIVVKELVEAKRRRRGRDNHKRRELYTKRADYRGEVKSKRSD